MLPHQSQLRARWWDCKEVMHRANLHKLLCSGRLSSLHWKGTGFQQAECTAVTMDLSSSRLFWHLYICKVFVYLLFYESVMLHSWAVLKKIITFCILILCLDFCWAGCSSSVLCVVVMFVSVWSELAWEKHATDQSDSELVMMSSFWGFSDRRVPIT